MTILICLSLSLRGEVSACFSLHDEASASHHNIIAFTLSLRTQAPIATEPFEVWRLLYYSL
eukprot:scaffold1751_cov141-Skeletonema_menzelii.AAC.4